LPTPPSQWIEEILAHHQIDVIDLDLDISIKATELPPIHTDPCDRFIIATALTKGLPLVTADQRFTDYGVEVLM
jgi:PIN domain nuclease of toxin-antitoxin system